MYSGYMCFGKSSDEEMVSSETHELLEPLVAVHRLVVQTTGQDLL